MMNKIISVTLFCIGLWLSFPCMAKASVVSKEPIEHIATEKVSVTTDRSMYIMGEQVQFAASIFNSEGGQSHVLYVEIITPQGRSLVRGKYSIIQSESKGCIQLPDELITGVYYLKAYTKYMRSEGPGSYAFVMIRVLNPHSDDVMNGSDEPINESPVNSNSSFAALNISTGKSTYAMRENVTVEIQNQGNQSTNWHHFSLSVIPQSSAGSITSPAPKNKGDHFIAYIPETRGISLTGQLKNTATGMSIPGQRINLSIIGEGRDFMAAVTDSTGHFYFALPDYSGHRDLFLCRAEEDTVASQLLIDNDYCSLPVQMPAPEFKLTDEERNVALTLARNEDIHSQYQPDSLRCRKTEVAEDITFYGTPSHVIRLDEYISLPSLEEYLYELAGAVNVKKKNKKKYFKVIGDRAEMNYYDPLVLVDYVAVNNIDKILAATPASIDRVEVINVPYVKGDITYGGIVSIISKKGDFGGIDLPASGIFVNYDFFADACVCETETPLQSNFPDARNTVYWNPDLDITNSRVQLNFTAPDTPGIYDIILSEETPDGVSIVQMKTIEVKREE